MNARQNPQNEAFQKNPAPCPERADIKRIAGLCRHRERVVIWRTVDRGDDTAEPCIHLVEVTGQTPSMKK